MFYRAQLNGRVRESFKSPNKDMSTINLKRAREESENGTKSSQSFVALQHVRVCMRMCVCEGEKGE